MDSPDSQAEMPWFRCWVKVTSSLTIRRLPVAQRWLFIAALAVARRSPEPGRLLIEEGIPATTDDLADAAALPAAEVEAGLQALVKAKTLRLEGDTYIVVNWRKYQQKSDNATQRKRDWRAAQAARREAEAATAQPDEGAERGDMTRDSHVTSTSRATPRKRARGRSAPRDENVVVSAPESESETESVGTTVPTGEPTDDLVTSCELVFGQGGHVFIPAGALAEPFEVWEARCALLGADPNHDETARNKALGIIKRLHHQKRAYSYVDIFRCWRYLARQEVELNPEGGWRMVAADFPAVWNTINDWYDRGKKDRPPVRATSKPAANGRHDPSTDKPLDPAKYTGNGAYAAVFKRDQTLIEEER